LVFGRCKCTIELLNNKQKQNRKAEGKIEFTNIVVLIGAHLYGLTRILFNDMFSTVCIVEYLIWRGKW
jgi:hypothetical protein